MVDRVYQRNTSDSAPQPPTDPSIGYPTGGNPAEGVPATIPGPYWYHMITESLRRVVVAAGLEPDHLNLDRLKDSVRQAATESIAGLMKVATQAQVNAGEDDTTVVTPKKLSQSLDESALGRGQVWQNVSSSRAGGVTYTNTTGRPIFISMFIFSNKTLHISVDGKIVSRSRTDVGDSSTAATDATSCAIVPNGSTYSASITPSSWLELR